MEKTLTITSKNKEYEVELEYFYGLESAQILRDTTDIVLSVLDLWDVIRKFFEREQNNAEALTVLDALKLIKKDEIVDVKKVVQAIIRHPDFLKILPTLLKNVRLKAEDVSGKSKWFILNKQNIDMLFYGNIKLMFEIAIANWRYNYQEDFFGMGDGTDS